MLGVLNLYICDLVLLVDALENSSEDLVWANLIALLKPAVQKQIHALLPLHRRGQLHGAAILVGIWTTCVLYLQRESAQIVDDRAGMAAFLGSTNWAAYTSAEKPGTACKDDSRLLPDALGCP